MKRVKKGIPAALALAGGINARAKLEPLPPLPERLRSIWEAATSIRIPQLTPPQARDPERRERCKLDALAFGATYFPMLNWEGRFLREYIGELQAALLVKGAMEFRKALHAPRGIGKTTAALIVLTWAECYRICRFSLILGRNDDEAKKRMVTRKALYEGNVLLAEDFPELCGPIRGIGGDPRRARAAGFYWSDTHTVLPNRCVCMSCGLDKAVRGMNWQMMRPDVILIDDAENEATAYSEAETEALRRNIEGAIAGLAEKGRRSVFLWLSTIVKRGCLSDEYTDPAKQPEWRGRRWRGLISPPVRADLWEQFREICAGRRVGSMEAFDDASIMESLGLPADVWAQSTETHRQALRFYGANRPAMDAGAEVLDPRLRPLHDMMFEWATKGERFFLCEIQGDPPKDDDSTMLEMRLVPQALQHSRSECDQGVVPGWASHLTASIDMGLHEIYWTVDAWGPDQRSHLVANGIYDTGLRSRRRGLDEVRESDPQQYERVVFEALGASLDRIWEALMAGRTPADVDLSGLARHYVLAPVGQAPMVPRLVGVDCGGTAGGSQAPAWYSEIVSWCAGHSGWLALKGARWTTQAAGKAAGLHWLEIDGRVDAHADWWKLELLRSYEAGRRTLHAQVSALYLRHMCSEKYLGIFRADRPVSSSEVCGWQRVDRANHWWDCGWMAYCLGSICQTIEKRRAVEEARPKPAPSSGPLRPPAWTQRERF